AAVSRAAAYRTRGNKYFNAGRFNEAIDCYSDAILNYPAGHSDLSLAYANRAACHLSTKNYSTALEDCNSGIAIDRRSRVLENLGRLEEALVDALAAAAVDSFKTKSFFDHVEDLLKKFSEARKPSLSSAWMITHFLSTFPREWNKVQKYESGELKDFFCKVLSQNYGDAYAEIVSLAKKNPESQSSDLYNWLGTMHFLAGDFENAQQALTKAIDLNESSVSARVKLALVSMELGQYAEMTMQLEKAIKIDPSDASCFYHRGEIFALSNNLESAVSEFARAIQLEPEFIPAYVHQARAYMTMNMSSSARDFIQKALKLFPENPELLHVMGECWAIEGQYNRSLELFSKVELMAPDFPQVLLNKALIMSSIENNVDMLGQKLKEIVAQFPYFDAAHVQLAGFYIEKKETSLALKHYDIAAEHARSYQELVTIYSMRAISSSQAMVVERFPDLAASIQDLLRYSPVGTS
ncbi:Subunit Tom70 of mitochondrial import receptor, partial [Paramicrosporidium saccamoebae]